jgi:plastocyanin
MLRLVAHARKLAIGSALAIASLGIVLPIPAAAEAAPGRWVITVGGGDFQATQLTRFYPNNITVHPGDVVSFAWLGFHTVTFNQPASFTVFDVFPGPNGATTLDSRSTFILAEPAFGGPNSGPPANFDLTIASNLPNGKYAFHCSLHQFMKGVINVTRGELPATNADNQTLGNTQAAADLARLTSLDNSTTRDAADKSGEALAGISTKAGDVTKFYPSAITVNAGDQLTFTDPDVQDPHTVTFGPVPNDPNNPFLTGVFPSGANPKAFNGTSALNSGDLFHKSQADYWNLKGSPAAALRPRTEWSVTFTTPGTYNFYCDIHGRLNADGSVSFMSGTITVLPAEDNH